MNMMIYGLQRAGTNYTEAVILENFKDVRFLNEHFPDCLPTQKHFRLYDEKFIIPSLQFQNNFHFPSFKQFDEKVEELTQQKDLKYVVVVKNPYAWYQSFMRLANRTKHITYRKKHINGHFVIDWNLFHSKWLSFFNECPEKIELVKYEDLVKDFDGTMKALENKFGLKSIHPEYFNPKSVGMSRKFTKKRNTYYKGKAYLADLHPTYIRVISELLDKSLMERFDYEWIQVEPTYEYQNNYVPKSIS
mgnify:CR=1 FL=1